MKSQQGGLRVAGFLFALFGLLHAIRLIKHIDVTFGTLHVPLAVSWIGLIVAVLLSSWMWRLSMR